MNYAAYPIFVVLALAGFAVLSRWLRRPGVPHWVFRAIKAGVAIILLGGYLGMEWAVQRQHTITSAVLMSFAATYAREAERLGHGEIFTGPSLNEARYDHLIDAQKDWMTANKELGRIYTLRKLADGGIVFVTNTERGHQASPGEPYRGGLREKIERALTGESLLSLDSPTSLHGNWVTALVPLHDSAGRIEAVLGVDFAADHWLARDQRARITTITITAVALLLHAAGALITVHSGALRVIAEQRKGLSTLEIEHAAIEEIVNSIDAIVWEWDITARRFTFISSQAELIIGYEVETWLRDPDLWPQLLHPDDQWADRHFDLLIEGGHPYTLDYRLIARDGHTVWIRETGLICRSRSADGHRLARGCMRDISAAKAGEHELDTAHRKLVENSRRAGMAEVATGVLHNVGNVLNGVNVSGNLIMDRIKHSRVSDLNRVARLVQEQRNHLPEFVARDPRGQLLPDLLSAVADQLMAEHAELLREVGQISDRISHIKDIVSVQQDHARSGGLVEPRDMIALVEDALKLNDHPLRRAQVQVVRDYGEALPRMPLDGHLTLQILVNLIRNAIDAIESAAPAQPCITVGVRLADLGTALCVTVTDNGTGVAPENLERIFSHGFTTKRHGHGFGLHSGAIAAAAMGGRLTAASPGPGCGATFTLEIPIEPATTADPAFWRAAGEPTAA